jgi:hypothetical protein
MKNKRHFFSILVIGFFTINILNSCQSQEQKKNEAFESFREEKTMLKDSLAIQKDVLSEENDLITSRIVKKSIKNETIPKVKVMDDWTKFKTETEKKITDNERKIKQMKGVPDVSVKMLRKVVKEEKANNNLRSKLSSFNHNEKEATEIFKAKMLRDLLEIDNKLIKISTNQEKSSGYK